MTLKKLVFIDTSYISGYIHISSPVLINQALWSVAQMVQSGILGHLGGDATAANTLAVQAYQVFSVVVYGASSAAGVVVGKCVGGGRRKELRPLVKTPEALFIGIGLISGPALFLASGPLLALMRANLTDRAQILSRQFMVILSLTTVGTAYQMACEHGIIRGGGDTATRPDVIWQDLFCTVVFLLPETSMNIPK